MPQQRHPFVLPDLELGEIPIRASVWLVPVPHEVVRGDRLLEVAAGDVTVDLPAPVSGRLVEQRVAEDDPLHTGQLLGVILAAGENGANSA